MGARYETTILLQCTDIEVRGKVGILQGCWQGGPRPSQAGKDTTGQMSSFSHTQILSGLWPGALSGHHYPLEMGLNASFKGHGSASHRLSTGFTLED